MLTLIGGLEMGIVLILIGVFTVVCTLGRFPFYWESRKARSMRRLIGDTGTTILYYFIGGMLFVMGVLAQFNLIDMQ